MASSADGYSAFNGGPNANPVTTFWLHATYTPNTMCRRNRAGQFRIDGSQ
jgi:hypothetical protein